MLAENPVKISGRKQSSNAGIFCENSDASKNTGYAQSDGTMYLFTYFGHLKIPIKLNAKKNVVSLFNAFKIFCGAKLSKAPSASLYIKKQKTCIAMPNASTPDASVNAFADD